MATTLNTSNPEYITWGYEQVQVSILGGIRIERLNRAFFLFRAVILFSKRGFLPLLSPTHIEIPHQLTILELFLNLKHHPYGQICNYQKIQRRIPI